MSKGRKKEPTAALERRGSKKVAERKDEPPVLDGLILPADLEGTLAAVIFDQYAEMLKRTRVISRTDSMALELLARTYQEYHELDIYLKTNGLVGEVINEDGSVSKAQRPEVKIRAENRATLIKLLREFGLTPATRPNLKAEGKTEKPVTALIGKVT